MWMNLSVMLLIFATMSAALPAHGETVCSHVTGRIVVREGLVEVRRNGVSSWETGRAEQPVCAGDTVAARHDGRATIRLENNTIIRLASNSAITFTEVATGRPSLIDMLKGSAYFLSRRPRPFSIKTPFANASVEGTEFQIRLDDLQAEVNLFEGALSLRNEAGSLRIAAGETGVARAGAAPFAGMKVQPAHAVSWALYYPPLFDLRASAPEGWQRLMELLASGRDEDVRRAVAEFGLAHSDLLAMQSLLALVQNRDNDAETLAQSAVDASPDGAAPLMACSYVRQSRGDINGALAVVEEITTNHPRHAVGLARYAELLLINGDIGRSREIAARAIELDPQVDAVAGLSGFSLLAERRPGKAREAFVAAETRNPAAPMPHLGLGIALIALRDVAAGREQIEMAVALDPTSSLLRSYLGKAYLEEGRFGDAGKQLEMAKEFDPNDPTPFLYTACLKQSLNRPVEALADAGESIARNENRLVYRSPHLLDQDLSVRLTSLAQVYGDLGFNNLALAEAARGLALDPDSPAGHRYLSDGYAALPRHQMARVSELLQSQLLNPLASDALQPHLHESRLGVAESGINNTLGYNEYSSLFGRRGVSAQAGGIVGNDRILGDELVVTGNLPRGTISFGQYHQQSEGFRPNADYRQDIYRVFTQKVLSSQTSVQAEYRFRTFDRGDLEVRFDPADYLTSRRQDDTSQMFRLGGRYAASTDITYLASLMYGTNRYGVDDTDNGSKIFGLKTDDDEYSAELQQLYRLRWLRLVSGMGVMLLERRDETELPSFDETGMPLIDESGMLTLFLNKTKRNAEYYSAYSYATITLSKNMSLIAGLGANFTRGTDRDRNQLNPKTGLVWNPLPGTTLRAATFRTLKKPMIGDQTVEPTNVAGFNQLYDDYESTSSWRYGVGIDQKIGDRLYAGAEYSWRNLSVPVTMLTMTGSNVQMFPWKEKAARGYVNAVLYPMLTAITEYRYERFERSAGSSNIPEITTQTVPLGVNLHSLGGFSASVTGTLHIQKGVFTSNTTGMAYPGSDRFWLLDASLSYRLPKRFGTVSLVGKNLADTAFNYQDMDPWSPSLLPGRQLLLNCSLNL
ncbi:MAG: TonB-dependent receptor [Desulfuromonadaceae bacterium]|nr:TonB-dependent receptor [Desulfuromonadaceae bacterium]